MAVKASAEITLTYVIDVKATYRYYLLQSSTLTKPAKPSTFPPASTWKDVEPNYVDGSTNSLYFVDCTVFCNDTYKYSEVSLSSAYEAAKAAYNKAANAQNGVNNLITRVSEAETQIESNNEAIQLRATKTEVEQYYNRVGSRGEQLVTNGNGLLGDNTNFSRLTFDGLVCNDSPGSFTYPTLSKYIIVSSDEFFPVNTQKRYTLTADAKSKNGQAILHGYLSFYDADKNEVTVEHTGYLPGTLTTLTQDLNDGDTVVHLADVSAWQYRQHSYNIRIWNYVNKSGYAYPAEVYTRNNARILETNYTPVDGAIDYDNNTVALKTAWTGGTIPAGTSVSQGREGANFKYLFVSKPTVPTEWVTYSGSIQGVDYSGLNVSNTFPPAVAYAKVGFLWNLEAVADQLWVTNITVQDTTAVNDLDARLTSAETKITQTSDQISLMATKTEVAEVKNSLGNYSTKAETAAAIKLESDSIKSTVSSTYTTKEQFNNLEIGGRNLLPDTDFDGESKRRERLEGGTSEGGFRFTPIVQIESSTEYTLSARIRGNANIVFYQICSVGGNYSKVWITRAKLSETDYQLFTTTFSVAESRVFQEVYICTQYGDTNTLVGDWFEIEPNSLKLEKGNKATDWTPAPEDVAGDISEAQNTADNAASSIATAETTIQQLADSIAALVRDGNGGSLIKQDSSGLWYFNIGAIEQGVSNTADDLAELSGIVFDANGKIDVLQSTAAALQERTEYVRSYTDENGQPCLELGEGDSVFKVRITNTEIQFAEGTSVPAYISNQRLMIEKAEIKDELQIGETPGVNLLPADFYDASSWTNDRYILDLPPGQYCIWGESKTGSEWCAVLHKSTNSGSTWAGTAIGTNGEDGSITGLGVSRLAVPFTVTDTAGELWAIYTNSTYYPLGDISLLCIEKGSTPAPGNNRSGGVWVWKQRTNGNLGLSWKGAVS